MSVIETLRMSLPDGYVCVREYRNKTLVDSMATGAIVQSLLVENEGNCIVRCLRYQILNAVNIFDFLGYSIYRTVFYENVEMNRWIFPSILQINYCLKFHNTHEKQVALLSG